MERKQALFVLLAGHRPIVVLVEQELVLMVVRVLVVESGPWEIRRGFLRRRWKLLQITLVPMQAFVAYSLTKKSRPKTMF
jgi:hypothetical protein